LSAIPREKERGRKSKRDKGADENWERTQNSNKRQQGENVATKIENNFNNTSRNNADQMEQKSAATTTAKTRRKSRKR